MHCIVKPLIWLPDAVNAPPLSPTGREHVAACLRSLQQGRRVGFPHSRRVDRVGARCHELFIQDSKRAWGIIVRADRDAVIVVAVFRRTKLRLSTAVIRACQRRLSAYDAAAPTPESLGTTAWRTGSAGWRAGSADDFLSCSDTELALMEFRLALQRLLRTSRRERGITQAALARELSTSQSRVAKIETGAPGVSLDLLIRAVLMAGGTRGELARAISSGGT